MSRNIEDKLDKIMADITDLKVDSVQTNAHLSEYNKQLEIHIKRSNALEEKLELDLARMEDEIKPIKDHVTFLRGAFWAISGSVAAIAGALALLKSLGILDRLF